MDEISKAESRRQKTICCDHQNVNIDEFSNRKKGKHEKKCTNLDASQRSDVGREKCLKSVSVQRLDIGSKKSKITDGSLTTSSTITEKVHSGESEERTSATTISYSEASSSGNSALKKPKKKSSSQKDANENEPVPNKAVVPVSPDGYEERFKVNGKKKKSKQDKHLVFNSPSFTDNDLPEKTEENLNITDVRTEANKYLTTQKSHVEASLLNGKTVQSMRETAADEVAIGSTTGILDDLLDENPKEGCKKSKKMKAGRNGNAVKNKSAVDDTEDEEEHSPKKRKVLRIADVETIQERNEQMTGSVWLKPAKSNAGIPRPNKNLFRRKMRCPVDGCMGRSTRMNRHLLSCHPELEASEIKKLMENLTENACDYLTAVPSMPVVPVLKQKLCCPVYGCSTGTIRLRRHLVYCHSELTPAERDELWDRVFKNTSEYLCTSAKDSTWGSQESKTVAKPKKSSAGIPRPNFKVRSRRRKQNCPVAGCHGAVINMRRHLVDCHSDIADEHEQLLEKLLGQRQVRRAGKKEALKQRGKCVEPSANTDSVVAER